MIGSYHYHFVPLFADPIITPMAIWLSTTLSVSVATATSMLVAGFSMAASFGMSQIMRAMAPKPDLRTNVTVREAVAPRRTIYGFWHGPGVITHLFSDEQSGWLEQVQTYAGHECERIGDLYLDKARVPIRLDGIFTGNSYGDKFADRVWYHWKRGAPDGYVDLMTVPSFPVQGANAEWNSDCRQDGCASIYVSLKRSDHFNGLPSIAIDIWGKKIYDPRNGSTAWSDNAALCYLDYLLTPRTHGGFGATLEEIDLDLFIAAANICDESVDKQNGTTEKRYTCNGVFTWDQAPKDIMAGLLSAFAGTPTYINGKYGVYAGAWIAPTVTLTDADLRGPLKVQALVSVRDLCNGVKGKYTSADSDWQPDDFPMVIRRIDPSNAASTVDNDYYLAQDDGYRMWKEIQLSFTTSSTMAQRLARIELEKSRRQKTVNWAGKLSCYQLVPPDTLRISRSRFAWTNKTFGVSDSKLAIEQDANNNPIMGVDLTLRETDADVYAWNPAWESPSAIVPMVVYTDDFNRANGPISGSRYWKKFTNWADCQIFSGRLQNHTWAGAEGDYWNRDFGPNQWAEIDWLGDENCTDGFIGVCVRADSTGDNMYFAGIGNGVAHSLVWGVRKSGVNTFFATPFSPVFPGQRFGIKAIDHTIVLTHAGEVIASVDDYSLSSGFVGVVNNPGMGNADTKLDNFSAGNMGGTSPDTTVLTPGATVEINVGTASLYTLRPAQDCTLNITSAESGIVITLQIQTSGTTSYNVTFGAGFRSSGVLATGTASGKVYNVTFLSNGTSWTETGRTGALEVGGSGGGYVPPGAYLHEYYISPAGNDSTGDGTSGNPWKTFAKAEAAMVPGDATHVVPGTYTFLPTLVLAKSGSSGLPITWLSDMPGAAHIVSDGSTGDWDRAVSITGAYVDFVGFDVSASGTTTQNLGIALEASYSRAIACTVHDIPAPGPDGVGGAGIVCWGATGNQVIGCHIFNIGPTDGSTWRSHGIYYQSHLGRVENNLVHNIGGGNGIMLAHAVGNATLVNNTIFSCGFGGIALNPSTTDNGGIQPDYFTLENNLIFHNGISPAAAAHADVARGIVEYGATPDMGPHASYINNLVFGNPQGNWLLNKTGGTGTGTITADPAFVNWQEDGSGDYHLASGSPAKAAGSHLEAPANDYAGTVRADPPSIGAYE